MLNEDLETQLPESVTRFQMATKAADGVILVTPEYNRSFSAAIKNALDWGSRPDGVNVWEGKPVAFAGATLYNLGTFGAQNQLRQVAMYLNMQPLQQPEFYLEHAADKFDEHDQLTNTKTQEKVIELWNAFRDLLERSK
jgi:chromate reductase